MTQDMEKRVEAENASPIKKQLLESSLWFISLRWVALSGIALGGLAAYALGFQFRLVEVLLVVLYLLGANLVFWLWSRAPGFASGEVDGRALRVFNILQVIADWGAVLALIYISGGITSPIVFFFFVHLVIAAILQPGRVVYPAVTAAVLLLGALFFAESQDWLPRRDIVPGLGDAARQPLYVLGVFGSFTVAAYSTVFLTGWVSRLLSRRMRQLSETKIRLEDAGNRLEAIYEIIRHVGSEFVLEDMLNSAVQQASRLWGIRSAFIALRDPKTEAYSYAAVMELSNADRPEAPCFLTAPPFAEAMRLGEPARIGEIQENTVRESCPSLDWLARQGKRSLIAVPLIVSRQQIGAFCLTSQYPNRFTDEDGKYLRIFCDLVAIDIESARMNRALHEHNRTRTWFYQRAAHDLRSPLMALRSMLSLVIDGYVEDPAKIRETVVKANARAGALADMINDLLLLAEGRLDALKDNFEELDLRKVLDPVVELYRVEAQKRGLHFDAELPEMLPPVRATRDGLERIFNNLISNAMKYTLSGGAVTVRLDHAPIETLGRRIRLTVRDTGIGIPESSREQLFQEFYRAPNAKRLSEVGTGLGLSITKKLVEDFGGEIVVDSLEGQGTTFTVSFPAVRGN